MLLGKPNFFMDDCIPLAVWDQRLLWVIVAINKDKEANIFNVAHFGIIADYKEVLPSLTAKLKELKSA